MSTVTNTILSLIVFTAMIKAPAPKLLAIPAQASQYKARVIREAHAAGGLGAPVANFAAQFHQESGWKDTAKSGVGALGLGQFMPGSAAWIANVYPADLKPGAPYDADWSIRALIRYDYWLYARVPRFQAGDERWAAALASYNAGLGWILKDQKAATCDASIWFSCVATVPDKRTADNQKQSRDYPERILHRIRPSYLAANWN